MTKSAKAIPGWLAFEHQVFRDAIHFTYISRGNGPGQQREQFDTWPEAKARASRRVPGERFLIYAVTKAGRSAQIPVTPEYDSLWAERKTKR